jgi:hypothetical protein
MYAFVSTEKGHPIFPKKFEAVAEAKPFFHLWKG